MNKVVLIGNLTRDPELRTVGSGASVCSFAIAVNRRFAGADGNRVTDFFNISAWRQLGENCSKFLKKGSKVGIVGEIQIRQYDAQDGSKRTTVEIVADEVEFLSPRSSEGGYAPSESSSNESSSGMQPVADDNLPF